MSDVERAQRLIEDATRFARAPSLPGDAAAWLDLAARARGWLRELGRTGADALYPDHGRSPALRRP